MGSIGTSIQVRGATLHGSLVTDSFSREAGFTRQSLYCYRKLYSLDPTNVDALWDRASLAKEIGDLRTVSTRFHLHYSPYIFLQSRHALLGILKRFPHDLTVLDEIRTVLIELSDLPTCATLFQQAFEHYQALYPTGRGPSPSSSAEIAGGGFGLMEVLVLADLYNTIGEHERAIDTIRKGSRWLQGRGEQKYWDMCNDDREFDLPDVEIPSRAGGDGAIEPGRYPLDVNARHRLAVARIKTGEVEEGKVSMMFWWHYVLIDWSSFVVACRYCSRSRSSRLCTLIC